MALGTAGYTDWPSLLEQNDMQPANGKVLVIGATAAICAAHATPISGHRPTGKDGEHEFLKKPLPRSCPATAQTGQPGR
jgi:hypothetical protein